jgi:hypothetical protein
MGIIDGLKDLANDIKGLFTGMTEEAFAQARGLAYMAAHRRIGQAWYALDYDSTTGAAHIDSLVS